MAPALDAHPDRIRWNARYAAASPPSFAAHPLAAAALAMDLPDGPVADLACGPSGAALLAAAGGRRVTAVDISELALDMLREEARRRGLGHLITLVHADLDAWRPEPRSHALVLCTGFWSARVFAAAAGAVAPRGVIGWEAFTLDARRTRPSLPAQWCLAPGEPASLLPEGFEVLDAGDDRAPDRRRMLARGVLLPQGPAADSRRSSTRTSSLIPRNVSVRAWACGSSRGRNRKAQA
jgi:SAM-dependent methyltransferase